MRLFAAVDPPPPVIAHLADRLRPVHDEQLSWSGSDAWHITLAFYGQVDDARVPELAERLGRAARRYPPMELQLTGSGRFGSAVLWIGVHGDVEPVRRLASSAVAAGRRMGVGRDEARPFRPHVTVARARRRADLRPYVDALQSYEGPLWQATELVLVRSHLGAGPDGRARYELVDTFAFGAAGIGT